MVGSFSCLEFVTEAAAIRQARRTWKSVVRRSLAIEIAVVRAALYRLRPTTA